MSGYQEYRQEFVGRNFKRNYLIGIINGAFFLAGISFLDPTTVLPVFLGRLTSSSILIGGVSTIFRSGVLLSQFFMANVLETKQLKKPTYVVTGFLRCFSLIALAIAVLLWGDSVPALSLGLFLVAYSLYSIFSGMGMLPFSDVVAKTIYPEKLGSFMAYRHFWGSLLSIAVGITVSYVLSNSSTFPYPTNFALLFFLGSLMITIALSVFAVGMREPKQENVRSQVGFKDYLALAVKSVSQDKPYLSLLIVRLLVGAEALSLPFLIRYATNELGIPVESTGAFLSVQMFGGIISSLFWGKISDKKGNRMAVQLVCVTAAMIFFWALFSPSIAVVVASLLNLKFMTVLTVLYACVFFFIGAFLPGQLLAFGNYVLEIAPEEKRPTYVGLTNSVSGLQLMILPLVGGLLVDVVSYRLTFFCTLACIFLSIALSLRLTEPRDATTCQPNNKGKRAINA